MEWKRTIGLMLALASMGLLGACTDAGSEDSTLDWTTQLLANYGITDNNNGTVTDSNTGRMWMKCSHGQVFNSGLGNCAGTGGGTTYGAKSVNFCEIASGSSNYCININASDAATNPVANDGPAYDACVATTTGGFTNWRLPTYGELEGIASGKDRSSFQFLFPQTPDDKYFWTANGNSESPGDEAYAVSFAASKFGERESFVKYPTVHYVRCVRTL